MNEPRNVTVIGAGIVGMACACYLKRDGKLALANLGASTATRGA